MMMQALSRSVVAVLLIVILFLFELLAILLPALLLFYLLYFLFGVHFDEFESALIQLLHQGNDCAQYVLVFVLLPLLLLFLGIIFFPRVRLIDWRVLFIRYGLGALLLDWTWGLLIVWLLFLRSLLVPLGPCSLHRGRGIFKRLSLVDIQGRELFIQFIRRRALQLPTARLERIAFLFQHDFRGDLDCR